MTVTIISISNPRVAVSDGSLIDVTMNTEEHGEVVCSLHPDDKVTYSYKGGPVLNCDLYRAAHIGEFGTVKDWD